MQNEIKEILKTKEGSHIACITYEDNLILQKYFAKVKELEKINDSNKDTNIIKENKEEYETKKTHNKHDKLFKDLFANKEETAKFLNTYLGITEKIEAEELEKYNSSYITKMYEGKEADIVYKLKNRNVFFLIEHQSTVDKTMPWRIFNYINEIMHSAVDKSEMKNKGYKYPQVIPIVLYTGRSKWDVPTYFTDIQENILIDNKIVSMYNLVDINECEDEKLLNDNMLISKAMLIEKGRNKEEVVRNFKAIIEKLKEQKIPEGEHLINVMQNYMLSDVLDTKDKIEVKSMLEKEGGGNDMLNCARVINEENARLVRQGRIEGKKEGRKEGIRNMIINMIKNQLTDEQIKAISGISDKELSEIKRLELAQN